MVIASTVWPVIDCVLASAPNVPVSPAFVDAKPALVPGASVQNSHVFASKSIVAPNTIGVVFSDPTGKSPAVFC